MSDSYDFVVELVDKVSAPAKAAGGEILNFGQRMAALRAAKQPIEDIEKAIASLPDAAKKSASGMANLTDEMLKAQKSAGNLTEQMLKEQAAMKPVPMPAPKTGPAKSAIEDVRDAFKGAEGAIAVGKETITAAFTGMANAAKSLAAGDVKGAVQGVTDSVAGMVKLLDLAVPGLGQAVAMVVTLAGGLVGITAGLIQSGAAFALEASAAKQQMLGMFEAMGGGIVTGEQTEVMIDNLKAKTGVLKDELVEYTKTLMSMGETDLGKLETSVTAMASASALMGKEGTAAFTSLKAKIEQATAAGVGLKLADKQMSALYKTGANVDDVAKEMGLSTAELRKQLTAGTVNAAKFGDALESALIDKGKGPLENMTSALPYLRQQFSESMGDIFEDIEVKPFLLMVKDLFSIFSQGSSAGQTLKSGIGGFFNYVFATATKVVPYVKSFLLDLVIYGLRAYIALKPIVKTISDFATSAEGSMIITEVMSALWTVLKAVGMVVLVIVAAVGLLWGAMILVSVAVWAAVGAFLGFVTEAGGALTGWIGSAATAAYDFVSGLVTGIGNGASQVTAAVSGLADSATGAFKSALGIASPSKVMMQLGGYTTDGFAMGVEDGTADTQGALDDAVALPTPGAAGGAGGGGGGGPMIVVNFEPGSVVAGAASAGELVELLTSVLADKLEELLMQKGGATT